MKIKFSKFSKEDFNIAFEYYKKESESLALKFKNDIKQSLKRIETFPRLYPRINDMIQFHYKYKYKMKKFIIQRIKMTFTNKLIKNSQSYWKEYTQHKFIKKLAKGTLPLENFQHYLKQDYIYLFHYTRAFALAVYKSENFEQMNASREALNAIYDEIELHIQYCKKFGIDEKSIYEEKESPACISYTRYVLFKRVSRLSL